jgi:hypothetical protein
MSAAVVSVMAAPRRISVSGDWAAVASAGQASSAPTRQTQHRENVYESCVVMGIIWFVAPNITVLVIHVVGNI